MTRTKPAADRGCVFCGNRPLTKEHFLPAWLESYIDAGGEMYVEESDIDPDGHVRRDAFGRPKMRRGVRKQPPLRRTAKEVCASCNNGWMSRLEQEVKPLLIEFLARRPVSTGGSQQQALTRWMIKTAMIRAVWDSRNHLFSQDDLDDIRSGRRIPPGWLVFVGIAERDWLSDQIWGVRSRWNDATRRVAHEAYQMTLQVGALVMTVVYLAPQIVAGEFLIGWRQTLHTWPLTELWPVCQDDLIELEPGLSEARIRDLGSRVKRFVDQRRARLEALESMHDDPSCHSRNLQARNMRAT
jgi:hypothetical protein